MKNLIFCVFMGLLLVGCSGGRISSNEVASNFMSYKGFDFGVNVVAVGIDQTKIASASAYISNQEFKRAIETSLQRSNLFRFIDNSSDTTLQAFLIYYSYPYFASTFDAKVEIAWSLIRNNKVIYRRSFATMSNETSSNFVGAQRLRSAVVEAIKQNISMALTDISRQNF